MPKFARILQIGALAIAWLAGPLAQAGVTVLHAFDSGDGLYPFATPILGADGRLYGTTKAGGSAGYGAIFAVGPAGSGKPYALLHSIGAEEGQQIDVGLVQRADGSLFGSAPQSLIELGPDQFTSSGGTLFTLASDGSSFNLLDVLPGDCKSPCTPGQLTDGGDGYFYGAMRSGGPADSGSLFRMAPNGSITTLLTFGIKTGAEPDRQITLGADGRLYGALSLAPGFIQTGALFSVNRDGSDYRVLHVFSGVDGSSPSGALVALGGAWYGVAMGGGPGRAGTVFRIGSDGAYSVLYAFNGDDGSSPVGPLAAGPDGNLYGLAFGGGSYGGTIFRIAPSGGYLTLHRLTPPDGTQPFSGPIMDTAGTLYATTTNGGGGTFPSGSVFQFDALAKQPAALSLDKLCYNELDMCLTPFDTSVGMPYDVYWSSENLSSCLASGNWSGIMPAAGGRLHVVPRKPGLFIYRLDCTGPSGRKSATVTVSVI